MSLSHNLNKSQIKINGEILEKVIISNDLAGLSSFEKVTYIKNLCESLGLNYLTKPIQIIKFQGKEIVYFTKDSTEQLRKNHHISLTIVDNKIINDIYIVTANATTKDGRTDSSTGAVSVKGLNGDNLCNAMMKTETKAKRRVTLSICGLGMMDESEIETMKGAIKIDPYNESKILNIKIDNPEPKKINVIESQPLETKAIEHNVDNDILNISWASDLEDLQTLYFASYKYWLNKKDKINMAKCVDAKDKRKAELENTVIEFVESLDSIDVETGEIK